MTYAHQHVSDTGQIIEYNHENNFERVSESLSLLASRDRDAKRGTVFLFPLPRAEPATVERPVFSLHAGRTQARGGAHPRTRRPRLCDRMHLWLH